MTVSMSQADVDTRCYEHKWGVSNNKNLYSLTPIPSGEFKYIKLGMVTGYVYSSSYKINNKKSAVMKIAVEVVPEESQGMDNSFQSDQKVYALKEANFRDLQSAAPAVGCISCDTQLIELHLKKQTKQYNKGKWFATWMRSEIVPTQDPSFGSHLDDDELEEGSQEVTEVPDVFGEQTSTSSSSGSSNSQPGTLTQTNNTTVYNPNF